MRKEYFRAITFLFISSFVFIACEDRNKEGLKEKIENKSVNEWIFSEMDSKYLYYQDIPASSSLDYSLEPKDFFASLLSRQHEMKTMEDGTGYFYSYMETPENTKSAYSYSTYGIEFLRYPNPRTPGSQIARVLYVLKNSPAEKAGIMRGDFIYKVNNELLNPTNYAILKSGQAATLYKAAYVRNQAMGKYEYVQYTDPVNIAASEAIEDNPIHFSKVFEFDGRKIGYIVYNSFKFGPTDELVDFRYENEMRELMKDFKNEGVSDLILDLRYNGGGYLRTAQLLASTIVPESGLGQLMAIQEMNDKQEKVNTEKETNFYPVSGVGESNLNLNRLVVIGTRFTASASELIINCLRPYMTVIHVGGRTEGKNVGSYSIKNSKFPGYKLQPITIKIYNKLHKSDYRYGFEPDANNECDEIGSPDPFAAFGSLEDVYLKVALRNLGIDLPVSIKTKGQSVESPVLIPKGMGPTNNPKGLIVL